jgi:dethiobiotin synthetase
MSHPRPHPCPVFVTGIGTGIGKTLVSAILAEALGAHYWKPVQAGTEGETDSLRLTELLGGDPARVLPSLYELDFPASPHISARMQGVKIRTSEIVAQYQRFCEGPLFGGKRLIIEGAGGLLVPLSEGEFITDLIHALNARVLLVSRNYLGSINHSLLTAEICRREGFSVMGWIFNDQYLDYASEIAQWSNYPSLGSIPFSSRPDRTFVLQQAKVLANQILQAL